MTRLAAAGLLWQNYCRVTELMEAGDKKRQMKGVGKDMRKAVAPVVSRHPQRRHGANGAQMGAGSATLDGARAPFLLLLFFLRAPIFSFAVARPPVFQVDSRRVRGCTAHPPLPPPPPPPPPHSAVLSLPPPTAPLRTEYEWMLLMAEFAKKFCKANRRNLTIFPADIVGRPSEAMIQIKFVEQCLIPLMKGLGRERIMESTVQASSSLERALRMEIKSAFHVSNLEIMFAHYKQVASSKVAVDHLSFRATLRMMKDFQVAPDMCNAATLNALFHDVNMCAAMKDAASSSYDGDIYGLSFDEMVTFLSKVRAHSLSLFLLFFFRLTLFSFPLSKVCSHVPHFSTAASPSTMAHKMLHFFKVRVCAFGTLLFEHLEARLFCSSHPSAALLDRSTRRGTPGQRSLSTATQRSGTIRRRRRRRRPRSECGGDGKKERKRASNSAYGRPGRVLRRGRKVPLSKVERN